jgi:hypothetical protein
LKRQQSLIARILGEVAPIKPCSKVQFVNPTEGPSIPQAPPAVMMESPTSSPSVNATIMPQDPPGMWLNLLV